MNNASTDKAPSGDEDACLHEQHRALLQDLARVHQRLTRVCRLTDTVHVVDAARAHRLVYPTADGHGLSTLAPMIHKMQAAVRAAAVAHEARVLEKQQQQQRRLSVKMEELATQYVDPPETTENEATVDYDTDATQDAEYIRYMLDVDATDEKETLPKSVVRLATDTKRVDPSNGVVNPLVARASECLRLSQALTQCKTQDITAKLIEVFKTVTGILMDANTEYTFPRSGKVRGSLPLELSTPLAAAVDIVMDQFLQMKLSLCLAQSVLRLHATAITIRHPELKELLATPQQILRSVIHSFAERLGGMKRPSSDRPSDLDERAHDCFALAIDLLTTPKDDTNTRETLIDDVLHALKTSFRPVVLCAQKTRRREQPDARRTCVVTWAGRVLLLAARIVAHAIALLALLKADSFFKILQQIQSRHSLFPPLFQRMWTIVHEAPFRGRPLPALDLLTFLPSSRFRAPQPRYCDAWTCRGRSNDALVAETLALRTHVQAAMQRLQRVRAMAAAVTTVERLW